MHGDGAMVNGERERVEDHHARPFALETVADRHAAAPDHVAAGRVDALVVAKGIDEVRRGQNTQAQREEHHEQ